MELIQLDIEYFLKQVKQMYWEYREKSGKLLPSQMTYLQWSKIITNKKFLGNNAYQL